jgi:hypothetical protein
MPGRGRSQHATSVRHGECRQDGGIRAAECANSHHPAGDNRVVNYLYKEDEMSHASQNTLLYTYVPSQ